MSDNKLDVKTALITSPNTQPIVSVHRDEDSIRGLIVGNYLSQLVEEDEDEEDLEAALYSMPFKELIELFQRRGGFEIDIEDHSL